VTAESQNSGTKKKQPLLCNVTVNMNSGGNVEAMSCMVSMPGLGPVELIVSWESEIGVGNYQSGALSFSVKMLPPGNN
jgi:hypothetical protein